MLEKLGVTSKDDPYTLYPDAMREAAYFYTILPDYDRCIEFTMKAIYRRKTAENVVGLGEEYRNLHDYHMLRGNDNRALEALKNGLEEPKLD